jgi:Capsule assembly protein Wzi
VRVKILLLLGLFAAPFSAGSQVVPDTAGVRSILPVVADIAAHLSGASTMRLTSPYQLERERLRSLVGEQSDVPIMLRSVSALVTRIAPPEQRFGVFMPEIQIINNGTLPWSMNNGDLWAGRGTGVLVTGGFFSRLGPVQIVLVPEMVSEENKYFQLEIPGTGRPALPPDRSAFTLSWYVNGPYSIDMPTRFGDKPIKRASLGQSSILVGISKLQLGFGNENEWWGPGIGNALILSNNAPGFPHYFLRTAKPVATRIGDFDFRWLVGGLSESNYFDTTSTNNLRSIAAFAATLRTGWDPNLTFGLARSVYATVTGWGQIPGRWFDILVNTHRPNNRPFDDASLYPGGRDQVYSLFARWVLPESGFEAYGEWGRTEFPTSLRDLLIAPNHTQAYTLGFQWRRPGLTSTDFWRLQGENTSVEQSATFRDRPLGIWYTSRVVIQGYTNRGQPLGAAVGPGSSGQNLALDYMRQDWSLGLKAGRIRYNEDIRSQSTYLRGNWCRHDIYLYYGARAAAQARFGFAALDLTLGNRLNPWFQSFSGCPGGEGMIDIRNRTLSITFLPFMKQ